MSDNPATAGSPASGQGHGYPPPPAPPGPPVAPPPAPPRRPGRGRARLVAVVAIVLAVALFGVWWLFLRSTTDTAPPAVTESPGQAPTQTRAKTPGQATSPSEAPAPSELPPARTAAPPAGLPTMPRSVGDLQAVFDPEPEFAMYQDRDGTIAIQATFDAEATVDEAMVGLGDVVASGPWRCGVFPGDSQYGCFTEAHGGVVALIGMPQPEPLVAWGDLFLEAWK